VSKGLDEIDLKILHEIQADGRITNVELARRVGISPPPCLRRVKALEDAGYIQGYRGLLDPGLLGFLLPCYCAFQLGAWSMAAEAAPDAAEAARCRAAAARYAARLAREIAA